MTQSKRKTTTMSILKTLTKPFKKLKKTQEQVAKFLVFAEAVRPVGNFDQLPAPLAPDYNHLPNWAAHPGIDDKSHFTPKGIEPTTAPLAADIFYLHPTTFFGKNSWNSPLEHGLSREFVDEMVIPSQASVFNEHCKIYAPRYRQATFFSFLEGGKNAEKALELAFSDIVRAFDFYIKNWNDGRPFFIAGHSQGALHAMRLLEQRIENSDIRDRFVAAYVVGFRFPQDKFGTAFKNLKTAERPDQTGCIAAWDTYIEGGTPGRRLENRIHWYADEDGKSHWEKCGNKNPFGVNPLNWRRTHETVASTENAGAINSEFAGPRPDIMKMHNKETAKVVCTGLSAPFKHEVSATLKKDGFLYISKPLNRVFSMLLLPRGNYHMYDFALFYMNIRENVGVRLRTFLEKGK